jgi:cytochrome c oxidase cbb3-type subunit III
VRPRRRWAILAMLLPITLAALAATGCDWFPGRPLPSQRPIRPSQISSFAVLYGQNCAGCHGADGRFGASLPINNPLYLSLIDDTHLRQAVSQGVPGTAMPAFAQTAGGDLTDAQIAIVVQGVRRQWSGANSASLPSYAASGPGDSEQGQRDFQTYCESCHGPDGKGGKDGAVASAAFLALVSDQYLRTLIIAGRPDLGHPDFRSYGSRPLTDAEVNDLVAWLAAQRRHWDSGPKTASNQG